jgi:hypothetical protein
MGFTVCRTKEKTILAKQSQQLICYQSRSINPPSTSEEFRLPRVLDRHDRFAVETANRTRPLFDCFREGSCETTATSHFLSMLFLTHH